HGAAGRIGGDVAASLGIGLGHVEGDRRRVGRDGPSAADRDLNRLPSTDRADYTSRTDSLAGVENAGRAVGGEVGALCGVRRSGLRVVLSRVVEGDGHRVRTGLRVRVIDDWTINRVV